MKRKFYIILVLAAIMLLSAYLWQDNIRIILTDQSGDLPTYKAEKGCNWVKRSFLKNGVTAFEQNCPDYKDRMIYSEDQENRIIGTVTTNPDYRFTIQLFTIENIQQHLDVVKEWYAKLTPEQQDMCEIKNADLAMVYFPNGEPISPGKPHPTPDKIRYQISPKNETIQNMLNKYQGLYGAPEFDYICGHIVGSRLTSPPPYFEFDDRSPEKYLFIGSYGQDGPSIDLNSIKF